MESKKWYESKMLWIAVFQGVAGVLAALSSSPDLQAVGWIAIVKSLVDGYLRITTTTTLV